MRWRTDHDRVDAGRGKPRPYKWRRGPDQAAQFRCRMALHCSAMRFRLIRSPNRILRESEGGFDGVLPIGGGGFVLVAEFFYVGVELGVEGGAGVGDFYGGAVCGEGGDEDV